MIIIDNSMSVTTLEQLQLKALKTAQHQVQARKSQHHHLRNHQALVLKQQHLHLNHRVLPHRIVQLQVSSKQVVVL
jgi:hypothetical protein